MHLRKLLLSVGLAVTAASAMPARADDSGYVRVDLRRLPSNHLVATVKLNGKPAEMVIDTGAGWSCLDPSNDLRFGFRTLPGVSVPVNGQKHGLTLLTSLGIGSVEIRDHKMALVKVEGLTHSDAHGYNADGIIGLELLHRGQAVIACQQLRLYWKAALTAPDVMSATLRKAGWTAVKLEVKDNQYFADGFINKTPVRFLVDTGASTTLIPRGLMETAGVADSGTRFRTSGVHLEDMHAGVASPARLAVGGFAVKNFPVAIAGPGMFRPFKDSHTAILGADILGTRLGVIDCGENMLYLKSPNGG